jgi:hypothetical protein
MSSLLPSRVAVAVLAGALILTAGLGAPATAQSAAPPARAGRQPRDAARRPDAGRRDAGRPSPERILRDITILADDRMEGRGTGTPGLDSAAEHIASEFRRLRLRTVLTDSAGRPTYLQRFVARSAVLAHQGQRPELPTQNVVALIPGTDPALRGQVVVLGAHYDHLGREKLFSTDPRAGDAIRNGADDNASGTAAVLELARLLSARPPKRSVLLALFSGEELGLLGSQYLVAHAPVPTDSMVAMLNFDMVGRLADDKVIVYGVATADELPALVDSSNAAGPALKVRALGDGFGPSDHSSFFVKDIPVLHFFTDQHPDYHAATDDADKINAPGTARVVALAHGVARSIADRPGRLTFRRAATTRVAASGGTPAGPRPYLGSVPDMSADAVQGLRLGGVTPESPADKGGLKTGDVVVELDGKPVTDLYTYSEALYARKPGDTITIVVLRTAANGVAERVTATVTLGRRGE